MLWCLPGVWVSPSKNIPEIELGLGHLVWGKKQMSVLNLEDVEEGAVPVSGIRSQTGAVTLSGMGAVMDSGYRRKGASAADIPAESTRQPNGSTQDSGHTGGTLQGEIHSHVL